MESFLQRENERYAEMLKKWCHATWMVNATGRKEWQEKEAKAEAEFRLYCSNRERFQKIREGLKKAQPNTLQERQFKRFYHEALENQLPKEKLERIVQFSSELSNIFNTFRGTMDGKKVTENEIRDTLLHSLDMDKRKKAWEASKQIGKEVEQGLIQLVKLRNEAARSLGFADHHQMAFTLSELDREEVYKIFQRLKELTDEPFKRIKAEIDQELAERYGIRREDLRPWHY